MQINDLIMKDARYGNGLIIGYKGKYLFCIGKEKFWKKRGKDLIITYTAVGGNLEGGETFPESAYREAREEMNTDVEMVDARTSLYFDFITGEKREVELTDEISPAIIYNMVVGEGDKLSVCAYLARLKGEPKPSMEIPALILLEKRQVLDKEDKTLERLLIEGAEIIEQRNIPKNAILKPFGTAEIFKKLNEQEFDLLLL